MSKTVISLLLPLLAAVLACGHGNCPGARSENLSNGILKMIRYEHLAMAGDSSLSGEAARADELFLEMVTLEPGCIRAWVETGGGDCTDPLEAFLDATDGLPSPAREGDPASVVLELVEGLPHENVSRPDLATGYAAAFQLCLEAERDGTLMQELLPVLAAIDCPLTFSDLALDRAGSDKLREMAAGMSQEQTVAMPYRTGPFEYYITLVKLDSWGSKFKGQVNAATLAAKLLEDESLAPVLEELAALGPVTIGFLGDSNMDRIHWSTQAPFPDIVAAVFAEVNPAVEVVNAGKGGDDSGEALGRMGDDLLPHDPDLTFVMLGGNDSRHWGDPEPAVTPEQYGVNIAGITRRLREAGSRVVLMGYPVGPERSGADLETFEGIRAVLAGLPDSLGTGWLDIPGRLGIDSREEDFAVDRIHMHSGTHLRIADETLRYLAEEAPELR